MNRNDKDPVDSQAGNAHKEQIQYLRERAKELNCLYQVEDILNQEDLPFAGRLEKLLAVIPQGWQYPELCKVKIVYEGQVFTSPNLVEEDCVQCMPLFLRDKSVGQMCIYYSKAPGDNSDSAPVFLKEEYKLLRSLADRLSMAIYNMKYQHLLKEIKAGEKNGKNREKKEWEVIVEFLRATDKKLFILISRKMVNYLSRIDVREASEVMEVLGFGSNNLESARVQDENRPMPRQPMPDVIHIGLAVFRIAGKHISDQTILQLIQKWIKADKFSFLVKTVETLNSSWEQISDAICKYYELDPQGKELQPSTEKSLKVSLISRFFFDQLEYVNVAKHFIDINDFYHLIQRVIAPPGSHGKLGGKSSGLFLAAQILRKQQDYPELRDKVKIPKTWYLTSDCITYFMNYNNLEDVVEQKYKEINEIRLEYHQIVRLFKNASFPPELIKGLSMALDDFGETPLIVRSSSLLEDRIGTAFSGKYKSLFIANQGTKQERLDALMDAIAEVYASIFAPDPIEYRAERGLLDFHEEMGILLQQVIGSRVGHYYFPCYAGVAFSYNEFRWSPRIKREDGLIRIVPGMGTRAVDRLSDDYPLLFSPGVPNLRVNASVEEMLRYSPQKMDVINLQTRTFESIPIADLLREHGADMQDIHKIVSVLRDKNVFRTTRFNMDFDTDDFVVTFDGLIATSPLMQYMKHLLAVLQQKIGTPVDVEFASDGKDFYLLQCRPQAHEQNAVAAQIPKDIARENILFTADKYISNGLVPDITHVVYVDPDAYNNLSEHSDLLDVGRAVGKLNKLLPKRQFILMGPGRWGSRGDIKLGVKVTYADFNNTAMLIEIARKKGNYVPDLSFGTHFFLDLVEASIRYLPLYPDDQGVLFNEHYLAEENSVLTELMPEYKHLAHTIRVVDIPRITNGRILRVVMNADACEAVGYLTASSKDTVSGADMDFMQRTSNQAAWRWRMMMAKRLASRISPEMYGIKAMYVIGSTKNATAGPGSDIDLVVHVTGTEAQKCRLLQLLEGWSQCLGEINFLRTGHQTDGLLDVHLITDTDIADKTSYAVKIGAVTDPAKRLALKNDRA